MTKDFHSGCSFDKGRHPRPRRGERLTLNLEEGNPPNPSREKYENSKSNFKDLEDGTAKSKSEKCELANLTERDLEDGLQVYIREI